ncbi:MAG: UDP-2,4-diacetamido-2,4,6-trideoxy-beta-L-altropyranose hydrolase [Pseudomonadota bacterium]
MATRKLLFRCDASTGIGLGHLSRCLNLADAVSRQGGACWFLVRRLGMDFSSWIVERGHTIIEHDVEVDVEVDVASGEVTTCLSDADQTRTKAEAARLGVGWIVVDSYSASSAYLAGLAGGNWRICVLDDLADRDLRSADAIVNPTPGAQAWPYIVSPQSVLLAGPQYALIHPTFAKARDSTGPSRIRPTAQRIMVCLGGTDASNLTEAVVDALVDAEPEAEPEAEIRAVVGPRPAAESLRARRPTVELLPRQSPAELASLMQWADLAVATASTVAFELSCLSVPSILIIAAANQARFVSALIERKLIPVLDAEYLPTMLGQLSALVRSHAERVARGDYTCWNELCDGKGAVRVASILLS